jgi:predicted ATPase
MLNLEDLLEIIEKGESEHTEFKLTLDNADASLASIIAFANSPAGGRLIFGVNDEGTLVGVLGAEDIQQRLRDLCQKDCEPPLYPTIDLLETVDGKVVVLHVAGRSEDRPYRQRERNVYWFRRGGRNQVADRGEIERYLRENYRVAFPAIRRLSVQKFRSLYAISELPLKPLNIVIGPNASGKSNLFKTLRFIREVAIANRWETYDEHSNDLIWYGPENGGKRPDRLSIKVETELPEQSGTSGVAYELTVKHEAGRLAVRDETVNLMLQATDVTPINFIERHDLQAQYYAETEESIYVSRSIRLSPHASALREVGRDSTFAPLAALYRFIAGWRVFDIDARAARQSTPSSQVPTQVPSLAEDGSNLSAFMYALAKLEPERFEVLQDYIGRAIGYPEALQATHRASLTGGMGEVGLSVREKAFGNLEIPADSLSDGTIRLLAHLAAILGDMTSTVICIEEPDYGLHPHLMLRLADALRSVVEPNADPEIDKGQTRRPQILLTTHNPAFLDCFDLSEERDYLQVIIAERDAADGKTRLQALDATSLAHWLKDYRLGELVRMGVIQ